MKEIFWKIITNLDANKQNEHVKQFMLAKPITLAEQNVYNVGQNLKNDGALQ